MRRIGSWMVLAAFGCASEVPSTTPDASDVTLDASSGLSDAAAVDAAAADANEPDASVDAGIVPDAAAADAQTDAGMNPDSGPPDSGLVGRPYPDPAAHPANAGPGIPAKTFTAQELLNHCAYLDGGSNDLSDHHNLVTMFDGYLLMPWSPEFGTGGLTFFNLQNPCSPTVVGSGYSREMRETHALGIAQLQGKWWAVVDQKSFILGGGGIQFWDITSPAAPTSVKEFQLDGFIYPDAYARVTLSVFWQAPYVYVGFADNGIAIVDASDPTQPTLVGEYDFEPTLRVGQVQVVGNLLIATAAEGPRTVLLDVSDPASPQPIPGGDFLVRDRTGAPQESYFSTFSGGKVHYAIKSGGGGLIVWDVNDPTRPQYAGERRSGGNGGYVFVQDERAFVGESSFAAIYDLTDTSSITQVARLNLTGDLDTITPLGNMVVLSVDADADRNKGSAITPWKSAPDTTPPRVTFVHPLPGETGVPLTSRVGVTMSKFVDIKSAYEGSVRLYKTGTTPGLTRVDGTISVQEGFINFWPKVPLERNTEYTFEIPAGGVRDLNGNRTAATFTSTFTTF